MSKVIMNAAFWREPAEEWRAVAHDTIDPEEKRLLLELVAYYERLAERAAQREPNQSRNAFHSGQRSTKQCADGGEPPAHSEQKRKGA